MDEIRVGIVGCGTIFPMHAHPVKSIEGISLAAVCDDNPQKARRAAEEMGCDWYTDYEQFVEKVDVIHICTPHYLHPPMAITALKAGKHVLTEKPMGTKYEDACAMIQAAKDSGRTLGVIFQNRYNNASALIKNTLDSGELGAVKCARLFVMWHRSDAYYDNSDWRGKWATEGGGLLINQAIHTFDLVRWFMNSPVVKVDATIKNRFHKTIEVEDMAEGVISFANGVDVSFYATNYYGCDAPVQVEIVCEKGTVSLTGDTATITTDDGRTLVSEPEKALIDYGTGTKSYWGQAHYKQIKDFYRSLLNGEELFITAEDAVKTQKLINDIYYLCRYGAAEWGLYE